MKFRESMALNRGQTVRRTGETTNAGNITRIVCQEKCERIYFTLYLIALFESSAYCRPFLA